MVLIVRSQNAWNVLVSSNFLSPWWPHGNSAARMFVVRSCFGLVTCVLHVFYMCFTCVLHVFYMCFTCVLHVFYMCFTCVTQVLALCLVDLVDLAGLCSLLWWMFWGRFRSPGRLRRRRRFRRGRWRDRSSMCRMSRNEDRPDQFDMSSLQFEGDKGPAQILPRFLVGIKRHCLCLCYFGLGENRTVELLKLGDHCSTGGFGDFPRPLFAFFGFEDWTLMSGQPETVSFWGSLTLVSLSIACWRWIQKSERKIL